LLLLVIATPSAAQDLSTEHFEIRSSGNRVPAKDVDVLLEALYGVWKAKLGPAAGAPGKLKVVFYFEPQAYAAEASLEFRYAVKEGTLHVLCDQEYVSSLAAGGALLYVSTVYPSIAARKDAPWLLAGLRVYFAGTQWSGGAVQIDSVKQPAPVMNLHALQWLLKKGEWWASEKAIAADPTEIERRRLLYDLESWAGWWVLFNAPGDGGNGRCAASVPDFLAALQAGKKTEEAFKAFQKSANIAGPQGVDKLAREYLQKQRLDTPDQETATSLSAETPHYSIAIEKGEKRKPTGENSGGIAKKAVNEPRFLEELKWKMELMYEKYHLAFRLQFQPHRKSKIRIYAEETRYLASGGPRGSIAYYDPRTKEMAGFLASADFDQLFNTLCHEGTHQFFDLGFPHYRYGDVPPWFSEGFAECMGSGEVRGKDLHVFTVKGIAETHLRMFKDTYRNTGLLGLDPLLKMDQTAFSFGGPANYARSWSFVHFLWNYPSVDSGHGDYSEVLIRMIDGFKAGKASDDVWRDAFQKNGKPLSLEKVDREWSAYTKRLHTRD